MSTNPEIAALGPNAWARLTAPYPADASLANGGKRIACHQWLVDGTWSGSSYVGIETLRNTPYYRTQSGIQYGQVGGRPKVFLWGGSHVGHPGNDVEILDVITGVWTQQYQPESPMLYWGTVVATDNVSKVTISTTAPSNALGTSGRPSVSNAFQSPNVIAFGISATANQGMSGIDASTPYNVSSYNGATGEVTISGTFTGRKPTVGWTVAIWHSVQDWAFGSGFQCASLSPNARPYADHSQDWSQFDPVNEALLVLSPAGTMRYSVANKTWGYLAGPYMQGGATAHPNSDIAHRALMMYDPDLAALGNSGFQALVTSVVPSALSTSAPGKWIMSATGVWTQRWGLNTATKGLPPGVPFNSAAQIQSTYCTSLKKHIVQFLTNNTTQVWYLYDAVTDVWTLLNGTPTARMGLTWDDLNSVAIAVEIPAGPGAVATVYAVDVSTDPVTVTAMSYETMHPTNLSGQTGVTINLLKYDDYHKVVLFNAPVYGATGGGGQAGTPFELWAYCYQPETAIAVQDWATRSSQPGVFGKLHSDEDWTPEMDPALSGNLNDVKGLFGASYPDNPPTVDTGFKFSGNSAFKFRINTNLPPADLRIPFTISPATNGRPVGQRIPRIGSTQPAGTFFNQFGAETAGGDGSGGVGQTGGGVGHEFYIQYRGRYDARAVKGYAAGGPQGGGGTPRIAITSITWSAGVATVTVSTTAYTGWLVGTKRPMVIGGATPSGYNSVGGVTVLMTRQSASAGTLIATYPLASDPGGTASSGFLYDASPGLKQFILWSQPNDTHTAYSTNTNLGLVVSSEPKSIPDESTTEGRYLLGAYIGPGAGNNAGMNTRTIGTTQYDQWPNDIAGGPHPVQSGDVTDPYSAVRGLAPFVVNIRISNPHWHRAPGGGGAVPAFSRLAGRLCDNGKGAYGYLNSPDPIGTTAPDKVVRSSGSWVTDGMANGSIFALRGTGVPSGFYRVTNTTTLTLTVEKVSQAGTGSSAALPTIAPRANSNVANSTLQLLPAGVVTVGGGVAAMTVALPLTDTDVVPVSPFLNQDQDGPITYLGLHAGDPNTPISGGGYGVLTALSVDKKTLTGVTKTGGQPLLVNGWIYGITGISRSWRDAICEIWWSEDGGPRRLLFNGKWKGPNGENSVNERLGCQFWQEDITGMFGILGITTYYNGINELYGASSDGYAWFNEFIFSTQPIADPPAVGATPPAPSLPVANFTGTPLSGTGTLTVDFTDASTNTPTSWLWNFGDSQTSNARNPSHLYGAPGTYSVTLTASNAAGDSTPFTRTNYVTVASPAVTPTADFVGTPLTGRIPLTVQFTDQSTDAPTSWLWDFGDGNTSTSQNPSHEYTVAGVYDVDLTATNAAGSDGVTRTNYVEATAPTVLRSKRLRIRL